MQAYTNEQEHNFESKDELKSILLDSSNNIRKRMDALFKFRTIGDLESIKIMQQALIEEPSSDLLRHEVCYCFGQMLSTDENKKEITEFLYKEVFEDPKKYNPIVLHEAAEALGNIDSYHNENLLSKFLSYEDDIIKETCEISIENLKWMEQTNKGQSEGLDKHEFFYHTNDPSAPFNFKDPNQHYTLAKVREIMHDNNETMFNRYRAIFTLREFNNDEAVKILCECFDKQYNFSALFKHEVAFILGQMCLCAKNALSALEQVLQDETEDPIVRHETALALGEITKSKDLLIQYSRHENQLIRESCEIALDFVDYWNNDC